MKNYCIVLSTFDSPNQAKGVIDKILSAKLAACIQTLNIDSHYTWNREICHDSEILVLFKTSSHLYPDLKNLLEEIHPYETPEIIKVPIEDGTSAYLKWIDDVTNPHQ